MRKKFKNSDVAGILYEIAEMLEMQGADSFRVAAYRRAARSIDLLPVSIYEVHKKKDLEGISGVGKGIAEKIAELLETGKLRYYEGLKRKLPVRVDVLMKVPGLGPKKIKKLNEVLGIKSVADLKKAAKEHKIAKIPGFGEESEKDILEALGLMKISKGRIPLKEAEKVGRRIVSNLKKVKEVKEISVAGSLRRKKATIRDVDILVSSTKPVEIIDRFTKLRDVKKVLGKGPTKATIVLKSGVQVDLRVLPPESWGAGLYYFTGSKDYNIEMRKIAIKKGYKLSEYGLFDKKTGKRVAGRTEAEICRKLGVKCPRPEDRER